MSMDFVFGLPKDSEGNTGIVVFVDRLSKMAHLAAVPDSIDAEGTAKLFIDRVFHQHGLPVAIISDRDPRFTGKFWKSIFKVLGTRLDMSQRIIRRPTVKLSV
uniref:Integrase catalytic domain-containing protein n=1 Tax=Peronospora matthiolae TaxID=2874970 RepID=A0AAV1UIF1_9STRA